MHLIVLDTHSCPCCGVIILHRGPHIQPAHDHIAALKVSSSSTGISVGGWGRLSQRLLAQRNLKPEVHYCSLIDF